LLFFSGFGLATRSSLCQIGDAALLLRRAILRGKETRSALDKEGASTPRAADSVTAAGRWFYAVSIETFTSEFTTRV